MNGAPRLLTDDELRVGAVHQHHEQHTIGFIGERIHTAWEQDDGDFPTSLIPID